MAASTSIALSEHASLRMLYNTGANTEALLKAAQKELHKLAQASEGYYYASDVSALAEKLNPRKGS